jgi:hypothetical protein
MKILYAIAILAQLAMALLLRNEIKIAYMFYLWNNLLGDEVQAGRRFIRPAEVSKPKEIKSHAGDSEYPIFLEP